MSVKLVNKDCSDYDISNITFTNFNCKNPNIKKKEYCVDYSKPINNDKLSYININHNNSQVVITTPEMVCPFGVNQQGSSFILNLQFTNYKENKEVHQIYDFINQLENKQIEHIGLDESNIDLYLSQIKRDKNKKYDPNLVIKIPFRYNKMDINCYNKEGDNINILNLSKFSKVKCDIYIDKIWLFNEKYICKWKLKTLYLR
jgi:hypothetical protein